jgi:hypothetical protein
MTYSEITAALPQRKRKDVTKMPGHYGGDFAYRSHRNRPKSPVTVTLECSHTLKIRVRPYNPSQVFGCEARQGCGYSLGWVSWEEAGKTGTNPKFEQG